MDNYIVVFETDSDDIEIAVNKYIKLGYKPVGGIMICMIDQNKELSFVKKHFYQAMIRNVIKE